MNVGNLICLREFSSEAAYPYAHIRSRVAASFDHFAAGVVNAVLTWIVSKGFWVKLQVTLMVLACLGVLWFEFAGNLLRITSSY